MYGFPKKIITQNKTYLEEREQISDMDLEYCQNIEIITLGIKKKAIVNILRDLMEKVDNTQEQIDDVSGDRK